MLPTAPPREDAHEERHRHLSQPPANASVGELSLLRDEVKAHLELLLKAQQKSELLAIDLAELLALRLDLHVSSLPRAG